MFSLASFQMVQAIQVLRFHLLELEKVSLSFSFLFDGDDCLVPIQSRDLSPDSQFWGGVSGPSFLRIISDAWESRDCRTYTSIKVYL